MKTILATLSGLVLAGLCPAATLQVDGTKVQTTWDPATFGFGARLGAFFRDLDADGDTDAGDAAVADLGGANTNRNIGIGGSTLVFTQKWQFIGNPVPGTAYKLDVVFPAALSRYYNGSGQAVAFDIQVDMDGSVTVPAGPEPVAL